MGAARSAIGGENVLSAYYLACGYIEQTQVPSRQVKGATIQVTLWREHSCYHVRAHEFEGAGRLQWQSFHTLYEARKSYRSMINGYKGERHMTKKHFEAFAREIKHRLCIAAILDTKELRDREEHAAGITAEIVADVAATDNPRFNRDKFMKACGL